MLTVLSMLLVEAFQSINLLLPDIVVPKRNECRRGKNKDRLEGRATFKFTQVLPVLQFSFESHEYSRSFYEFSTFPRKFHIWFHACWLSINAEILILVMKSRAWLVKQRNTRGFLYKYICKLVTLKPGVLWKTTIIWLLTLFE